MRNGSHLFLMRSTRLAAAEACFVDATISTFSCSHGAKTGSDASRRLCIWKRLSYLSAAAQSCGVFQLLRDNYSREHSASKRRCADGRCAAP